MRDTRDGVEIEIPIINIEASRMVRLGGDFAMLVFVSAPEDRVFELRRAVNDLHYTKFDVLTKLSEVIPFGRPA